MRTRNTVMMKGRYDRIFALAEAVEDWPRILPHYRYVRLHRKSGERRWVTMSAWRNFIPVTWSAIETVHRGSERSPGTILFKHIRGLVRGMDVEWSFDVDRGSGMVAVTIMHDLKEIPFPTRILGERLVERIVGHGFIGYIAGKTLKRIKQIVESEEQARTYVELKGSD